MERSTAPHPLPRYKEREGVKSADLEAKGEERVAAEAWHDHLLRNRSVLVDLLQGQLRSALTCSVCGHHSRKCAPPGPADHHVGAMT